ncbi:MAG: hypothetical protein M0C28_41305 [Candidatus Moduliflexus flocculans]|nr:hypothetical protein [Candidatus Moduliflexus flocculans]
MPPRMDIDGLQHQSRNAGHRHLPGLPGGPTDPDSLLVVPSRQAEKEDYDCRLTARSTAPRRPASMTLGIERPVRTVRLAFRSARARQGTPTISRPVYGVGPHTISFPRIQAASMLNIDGKSHLVSDAGICAAGGHPAAWPCPIPG